MATLAEHLALYDALRASILARHLALGRHHRANLLSLTNRLEPLSPALAARPPAEREVLRRWNVAEHERENPLMVGGQYLPAIRTVALGGAAYSGGDLPLFAGIADSRAPVRRPHGVFALPLRWGLDDSS